MIIVAHEDNPNNENMSWSIVERDVERESLGVISIWQFDNSGLDKASLLLTLPFQNRITNFLQSPIHCVAALDNGKLSFIPLADIVKGSKEIDKVNVPLFLSRTIELTWFIPEKYCIAIGDETYLKIFDFENRTIVNGGSLAKRLNGSFLTCMEIDRNKAYLGTNESVVLVYSIMEPDYQPKHLLTISLEVIKSPILSLKIRNE